MSWAFCCCCFCTFLGVCVGVWEWMCEWMSFQCHSCAQTLDRGEWCLGADLNVRDNDIIRLHVSESPGFSLGSCSSHPGIGYCGDCYKGYCCREMLQYVVITSTNVFCQYCPRREVLRRGTVLSSICQASWPSPTTTLDRKRTSKEKHHVWWVERFLVLLLLFFCRAKLECLLHTFTNLFC